MATYINPVFILPSPFLDDQIKNIYYGTFLCNHHLLLEVSFLNRCNQTGLKILAARLINSLDLVEDEYL